jgi:hypothetical protein
MGLLLISQSPVSTFARVSLASEIRHAGHLSDSRNFLHARAPIHEKTKITNIISNQGKSKCRFGCAFATQSLWR